jgi:hypothetical protein
MCPFVWILRTSFQFSVLGESRRIRYSDGQHDPALPWRIIFSGEGNSLLKCEATILVSFLNDVF